MKTNQLLKSSLALVTIAILATVTAFTVRQGEVTKTTHLTAPKDILQFTSGGHVLGFAKTGVYVATGSHALRVEFVNAHLTTPLSTTSPSETGNTKAAPPLCQVTYPNLWDGVTLTYDAPSGAVARSTYRLNPYAKTDNIRLRYNAPVSVQGDGSLRVNFKTGTLNESAPQAWQESSGKRVSVQIAFAPRGNDEITFTTGHYDRSQPLFIDPTLTFTWNTFLGGSGEDRGFALAVDGSGNVYVAGESNGSWGSPVNAYSGGIYDAFVAKLDSTGNLTWNSFLGGSGSDYGFALAVDGSGNIYVAGYSTSTWGSPVNAFSGAYDAFAAKLDSTGNLTWNTFLGGGGLSEVFALAVDGNGNVYVAGVSNGICCSEFTGDAFVAKLDSTGNLTWNTFLGSGVGFGLAVDGSGNVYVAGESRATWGSPVNAYAGGQNDAFAAKLDSTGNITWNTFLGGSDRDSGRALAVDGSGNVYVAGYSITTWGSPVNAFTGYNGYFNDAFAAKLDSAGNLTWNTFLGGGGDDHGFALAVDGSGNVYVAGESSATWGSPDRAYTGGDAFAATLDSTGNLTWNTFLGGSLDDYGQALAVDGSGNLYVAGYSTSTWGSPVNAFTGYNGYNNDAFVAKLSAPAANTPASDPPGSPVPVDIGTVGSATDITLTFPSVTTAGTTSVTPIDPPPADALPSGLVELTDTEGNPAFAFEITTTAIYPTSTTIIIAFQVPWSVSAETFSQLRVLHNEGGTLVDRTATDPFAPNPTTHTIYASVSSLSPFVIAKETLGAQVQQPINPNGSSVFSVKRGVVPVVFTLTSNGVATCQLPPATISLIRTAGAVLGSIDESTYLSSADKGPNFRISNCQYVYNLAASSLGKGTYKVNIVIGGTVVGSGTFALK